MTGASCSAAVHVDRPHLKLALRHHPPRTTAAASRCALLDGPMGTESFTCWYMHLRAAAAPPERATQCVQPRCLLHLGADRAPAVSRTAPACTKNIAPNAQVVIRSRRPYRPVPHALCECVGGMHGLQSLHAPYCGLAPPYVQGKSARASRIAGCPNRKSQTRRRVAFFSPSPKRVAPSCTAHHARGSPTRYHARIGTAHHAGLTPKPAARTDMGAASHPGPGQARPPSQQPSCPCRAPSPAAALARATCSHSKTFTPHHQKLLLLLPTPRERLRTTAGRTTGP